MNLNDTLENRIFKLSTGEKVNQDDIEKLVEKTCHYVKYVVVDHDENDKNVAFIFPDKELYTHPDYMLTPMEGCFCPRDFEELGRCLTGCLKLVNNQIKDGADKIKDFAMINTEKPLPTNHQEVIEKYKSLLQQTHGTKVPDDEEIYYIKNI